jgi:hypothetical protein
VKSEGVGVTVKLPLPPVAGAAAEAALRVTAPVAAGLGERVGLVADGERGGARGDGVDGRRRPGDDVGRLGDGEPGGAVR